MTARVKEHSLNDLFHFGNARSKKRILEKRILEKKISRANRILIIWVKILSR